MLKEEFHHLDVTIPYSLFVKLKIIALTGRYKGVKEFIKPQTDQFISVLVQLAMDAEKQNDTQNEQVEAGHIAIEQTA